MMQSLSMVRLISLCRATTLAIAQLRVRHSGRSLPQLERRVIKEQQAPLVHKDFREFKVSQDRLVPLVRSAL
jgi:hypothetical protein